MLILARILSSPWSICAALMAIMLLLYEGVPVLNDIPYVDRIPVIGYLVLGRVGRARQDGARAEASEWQKARLDAIEEQDRRRRQTQIVIDEIERDYLDRIARIQLAQHKELKDEDFRCVPGDSGDRLSDGLSRLIIEAGRDQSRARADPRDP